MTPQPSSPRTIVGLRARNGPQSEIGRAKRACESRLFGCSFLALILLPAFSSLLIEQASGQTTSTANAQIPRPSHQNPNGMRIYIWAGLKSHLPGQHDYPQFLADWSKILTEHGAVVDGALHGPSAADLDHVDVVIIYKGDAGYLSDEEKAALEAVSSSVEVDWSAFTTHCAVRIPHTSRLW